MWRARAVGTQLSMCGRGAWDLGPRGVSNGTQHVSFHSALPPPGPTRHRPGPYAPAAARPAAVPSLCDMHAWRIRAYRLEPPASISLRTRIAGMPALLGCCPGIEIGRQRSGQNPAKKVPGRRPEGRQKRPLDRPRTVPGPFPGPPAPKTVLGRSWDGPGAVLGRAWGPFVGPPGTLREHFWRIFGPYVGYVPDNT